MVFFFAGNINISDKNVVIPDITDVLKHAIKKITSINVMHLNLILK